MAFDAALKAEEVSGESESEKEDEEEREIEMEPELEMELQRVEEADVFVEGDSDIDSDEVRLICLMFCKRLIKLLAINTYILLYSNQSYKYVAYR